MKTPDLEKLRRLTLDEKTATPTYGRFVAEPFERGYGHTIGNSLRRILLSSLEGAAITSVRIKGALHEFAVIKGIKEDVASIVLNLKKVRLKMYTPGPETLYIKIKKEGVVTAKSIETNPNIEILNPEQEIATLDAGAELEIEMEICRGKGYVLAEESKAGKYPVNTIIMDALFSPVVKVNYEVENTRVEQITNYDRLIMEIWTDGSVAPADALAYSAKVLKNSLSIFTGAEPEEPKVSTNEIQEEKMKELLSQPLSIMDLSVRSANCLASAGLKTIGDLVSKQEEEIISFKNFGKRSLTEIKEKLSELGLSLNMNVKGNKND
ncbi:MAG TPA: DNA-directed RNA polymerase subunit alpha [Elusimicrobia bacterium]|nr:MAG: DNA-directed RNA polymerase subunit alpha [Elusimicrobia bacterium RIFOXYA12_FULL_49_49]OGS06147.1 MAG: DNA-directed RNA polymerase subunit alpha [Elusimicrobia bacterium RIFOXYA1_FULL_47_7]OGS14610.1 MAG: DNA-directed RNA polymerase subunit alpha [Elusimicrobia bacterium RIFOXYA2_FULL_47_53]OGS25737.1 MAG: DNA-directed RNA polymerase subunit alpha [Elusimicrobia bacterium RIFOXYB12_FULL_50_12]OGS31701.1 MAG: DNA-directed RNA polymerase subunit alpha [Elusimicrobia bacterium RIFOXYB2_FU